MPITILDYVKSKAGDKQSYPASGFYANGVEMVGGCEQCHATIAGYNAYPSKSGYWRCADCIGDIGFATVEDFTRYEAETGRASDRLCDEASAQCDELPDFSSSSDEADQDDPAEQWITCPSCGGVANVCEILPGRFECEDCEAEWTL